ncbi:MAG: FAD:protein FMN transferase [Lentisphaerae bacterium]|nr:FAD:protein FMN transferase [Lentisphaerota bacterium]
MFSKYTKFILLLFPAAIIIGGCGRKDDTVANKEYNWPAMGTYASLTISMENSDTAFLIAKKAVDEVNDELSVFVPESSISLLNKSAGGGSYIRLGKDAVEVLLSPAHYYKMSDGAFNPAVGPLVEAWGFFRGGSAGKFPPAEGVIVETLPLCDFGKVELLDDGSARLAKSGMCLDFGAIAKGYAVDVVHERLKEAGFSNFLINIGGNMRSDGVRHGGGMWRVAVRDPLREIDDNPLGILLLNDEIAVATSGDYEQYFEHDGKRFSHIIDPRTGYPAEGVSQVTVVARTAMDADALSTACFVLGTDESFKLLENNSDSGALFVSVDINSVTEIKISERFQELFVSELEEE